MTGRMTTVALLMAAATFPAQAEQDALQKLYELAGERSKAATAPEHDTKSGARSRFGSYEPRGFAVAESPVRSVMHYHRTPDGRLVAECRIERTVAGADQHLGPRPPREQR